jgi:uncharacterized protein (TIGR03083 family)
VDYPQHVDAVHAATDAYADALRGAPMDKTVASCPAWTLRDLTRHVWDLTGVWAHVLCEGNGRPRTPFEDMPEDADGDAVARGYAELSASLLTELQAAEPDADVYLGRLGQQPGRVLARRIAHEMAVHRFDAQLVSGGADPIAAELAADGIDEMFFIIDVMGPPAGCGDGQTLHLHGTDRGDEWMMAMTPEGLVVDRAHGKADMALRGAVSDLELELYNRPPVGPIERFGDDGALKAWRAAFTFE